MGAQIESVTATANAAKSSLSHELIGKMTRHQP